LIEQLSKPEERRCPIGRASNETAELLLDFYEVSDYAVSTHFQPLLLSFAYVHSLALRFFVRMWNDSAATVDDFARVSQVVRSQVDLVLADEERVFAKAGEVERGFGGDVAYKAIRERMLKEVEQKDDLLTKVPIR
jgi:engulfment/cell motility protein 1